MSSVFTDVMLWKEIIREIRYIMVHLRLEAGEDVPVISIIR